MVVTPGSRAARTKRRVGFYAHNNGVDRTGLTQGQYNKVTFSTARFDIGGRWDAVNNRWNPGRPGLVMLGGTVWWNAGAQNTGNPTFVAKIIKNAPNGNVDIAAGTGTCQVGWSPAVAFAQVNAVDYCVEGDYYELWAWGTSAGTLTIAGNAVLTFFYGGMF